MIPQGAIIRLFFPFSLAIWIFFGAKDRAEAFGQCVHDKIIEFLVTHVSKQHRPVHFAQRAEMLDLLSSKEHDGGVDVIPSTDSGSVFFHKNLSKLPEHLLHIISLSHTIFHLRSSENSCMLHGGVIKHPFTQLSNIREVVISLFLKRL